jgi:uncharacterized caspase-like protein
MPLMKKLMKQIAALIALLFVTCHGDAHSTGRRRAVLIGINDYTAAKPYQRDLPNLSGAVNDVEEIARLLVERHGFDPRDIVTLTNTKATRSAILSALQRHLLRPAAKDDVLLFYFAGHGSQVRNSRSDESDLLDESLVPADSSVDVRDIRDKELRPIFNRILDRGARLTVILDNCHSASGARGTRVRGVRADLRDVVDGTNYGPRPEDRGALVIAATQDTDNAWETRDQQKRMHGAFSWAWIRAMRDASPSEPASATFARAAARLRAERPSQKPVLAGLRRITQTPFLGTDIVHSRAVIAVEKVRPDGTILLHGGRADGVGIGTRLRPVNKSHTELTVTSLNGAGRSEARGGAVAAGALMEIVDGAAPDWDRLQSPDNGQFPYRLAIRRLRDHSWADDVLFGYESYELYLRAGHLPSDIPPRYIYVFVIDSHGRRVLLYGASSVENRFPLPGPAPSEISLGTTATFEVVPPYGRDAYYLLTTDEPLPNPRVLEWEGVRSAAASLWSIERRVRQSVPPRR